METESSSSGRSRSNISVARVRSAISNGSRVRPLTRKILRAQLTGSDTCTLAQLGLSVHSRSPVIKLARELIARGIDPRTKLEVFRGDVLALKVRSIGEAAGLCVAEGDHRPRFVPALETGVCRI
jgi:hypothetical protein